ncbi:MAG: PxxKW family cysteine-rich protein [Candidatus Electrothrix sp. YB6]
MQTSKAGTYSTTSFQPVIEQCNGCDRIVEENENQYCKTYVNPAAKWRLGICNFATHAKPEIKAVKVRLNPLKAAKRASSSRRK